jgi:hypothetical protein
MIKLINMILKILMNLQLQNSTFFYTQNRSESSTFLHEKAW